MSCNIIRSYFHFHLLLLFLCFPFHLLLLFLYFSFNLHGIPLPRTSKEQWNVGTAVSRANLKPGDLVFFEGTYDTDGVSHVGIYVGNNVMIHCGDPISYAYLNTNYWQTHFYAYGRLPN